MDPLGSQTSPSPQGTANSAASARFSTPHHSLSNPTLGCRPVVVLYTHAQPTPRVHSFTWPEPAETVLCSDFDNLLSLLEVDAVDAIVFDSSVNSHERNYITRWTRIFRPELHCQHQ